MGATDTRLRFVASVFCSATAIATVAAATATTMATTSATTTTTTTTYDDDRSETVVAVC